MVKHIKGARECLHDGFEASRIPCWHSNRLDKVVIINRGRTLSPSNMSLALRVPSLPPLWLAF